MGKLQAAYWLLMILPCAISLADGMAVRIRQKNLRAHINEKPALTTPPCRPRSLEITEATGRATAR